MSANSKIIQAITPLGIVPVPYKYEGTSDTYITFNLADERGGLFADSEAQELVTSMQIHFFAPQKKNVLSLVKQIKKALEGVGFTYPTLTFIEEEETKKQHYIFECEIESEVI